MKRLIIIFVIFSIYFNNGQSQETKISISKKDFETDSLLFYTFNITPYKGDSIYRFDIYIIDSLSQKSELISNATIPVVIRRIEKKIFFHDKFGNKLATFKFEYIIKNNEEYFDEYLKIFFNKNKKTLEGEILIGKEKRYKFVFDNSHGFIKEFDFFNGEIIN